MTTELFKYLDLFLLPLLLQIGVNAGGPRDLNVSPHKPQVFPSGFLFGAATSAYQHEGAYATDGKGFNTWDVFTHKHPESVADGSNGDVSADQYHHFMEDIDIMASLGVNSYRFSISWTRVLPKGRYGDVNWVGINHYNRVIDTLLLKGIQPFVTLYHYDFPEELELRYGGWLSTESWKDFGHFAHMCFKHFGDRVKHWVTLNEPNLEVVLTYRQGLFPPRRCSLPYGNCTRGDSKKEPLVVAKNMILAHATATNIYKTKYQKSQRGCIGIVIQATWFEPISESLADKNAAERAQSFYMNWFLDPIILGRYPEEMQTLLGPTLPKFSSKDMKRLKEGLDFIGVNHYSSSFVKDCLFTACASGMGGSNTEGYFRQTSRRNGVPIGETTNIDWLFVYPQGMYKIVNYLKGRYNNTPMFITENGYGEVVKTNTTTGMLLHDVRRIKYLASYLEALQKGMREGADVRGYFVWSLMDGFEWLAGYTTKFGLYHVDFGTLKRTPKLSAKWYRDFITTHGRIHA